VTHSPKHPSPVRAPAQRYRRAGLASIGLAGVAGTASLAAISLLSWPQVFQGLLAALTLCLIVIAFYALWRGERLGAAEGAPAAKLEQLGALGTDGSATAAHLAARMGEEQARVDRHGGSVGVLHICLEGLEELRGRLGPDAVGQETARLVEAMSESLRLYDTFRHLGGNEYLAVLPTADRRAARNIATRLEEGLQQYMRHSPQADKLDCVRMAAGVAAYPFNGDTVGNAAAAASEVLQEAWGAGRGGIVVSERYFRTSEGEEETVVAPAEEL
jgi:diguanylate cyclase (GGDEF)-like protein